ncbi:EamA family transporter [Halomonas heilongjiangensis]|uniref:EamA family transporter n=1 Tax=Halomonas heilongjiangensis TaxID=1387883 RepID=A0A2N7TIP8_9GAMM|nr:EamA family transporter [Halomonas heilongjiangensis]PXX92192.1 EamA family transporter [Halomonas heilongjiangensis]
MPQAQGPFIEGDSEMPLPFTSLLVAIGFVVCWSSGFVGGRLAIEADTPVLALFAWRFLLASLLVGLYWRLRGTGRLARRDVLREMAIGSLTMGGYLLGVILAIQLGVSAGVTALITALQPLLAAALAGPWLGERLATRGWVGMAIATLGMMQYVADDLGRGGGAPPWAYLLPLGSVVAVTLGSLLAVRWATAMPISATLLSQLLAATGIFTLAALIAGGGTLALPAADLPSITALGWLIVLSSLGGYGCFVASLRRLGVTLTSTLVYLTPAVTLLWAAAMFGEHPGEQGIIGMGIAIAGVGLAIRCVDTSGPRHHDRGARRGPRTWSAGETPVAAHRAPCPGLPHCDSPAPRP